MIRPNQLLEHMYEVLPKVTSRFFTKIQPLSARIDSNLNLVVTVSDPNRFAVGKHYNAINIDMLNPVTACVGSGATGWTVTTQNNHRITVPLRPNDATRFKTEGSWNAENIINDVPNRTNVFTRNGESSALTGFVVERLIAEDGYVLCTDIQGQEVTFKLNDGYVYPCDCRVEYLLTRLNVAVVPDIDRAKKVYTQNLTDGSEELYAFLIMGDRNTISDRNADAGITAGNQNGISYLKITTAFNVLVFWPRLVSKKQEASRFDIEEAYGPINDVFNHVFFGHRFTGSSGEEKDKNGYRIMPSGAGLSDAGDVVNFAFVYEFQAIDLIQNDTDGIQSSSLYYDVPIRDINRLDGHMFVSDGVSDPQEIFTSIDLDKEII